MEARLWRLALVGVALAVCMGASSRTPNFVVSTADPQMAEQIAKAAEKYRHDLAIAWTGKALPNWAQPCVMTVHVGANLGAGGATTFMFDRGEVYGWRMNIQGSAERVLDSVLPHEVTHMILASHFRCPVPRWADEGAATSVEHPNELAKHHRMLVQFLRTGRGISFSQMFAMTEYPPDVMPLYAQGYSLAEYLIMQGGRRKFIDFLGEGLQTRQWPAAIQHHYGHRDLGVLQNSWLAWVAQGFPQIQPKDAPPEQPAAMQLASAGKLRRPEPNLIYRIQNREREGALAGDLVPVVRPGRSGAPGSEASIASTVASTVFPPAMTLPASGWRPAGTSAGAVAVAPASGGPPAALPETAEPVRTQVTHPQPLEQPKQIVLQ